MLLLLQPIYTAVSAPQLRRVKVHVSGRRIHRISDSPGIKRGTPDFWAATKRSLSQSWPRPPSILLGMPNRILASGWVWLGYMPWGEPSAPPLLAEVPGVHVDQHAGAQPTIAVLSPEPRLAVGSAEL